jgi:hypothetical protein
LHILYSEDFTSADVIYNLRSGRDAPASTEGQESP